MLTRFAVTNYRGFANRIELDLSNPSNYGFNQFAISDGVVKNGVIYGPNGSGKTNLGLAIFDLEYHLAPLKAKKRDYYVNFVYGGNANSPVEFEYDFKFDGRVVNYKYSKDKAGILQVESLVVDGETLFSRNLNSFTIDSKYFPNDSVIRENLHNNANNVSVVNFLLMFYPLSEDDILIKLQQFVNNMLWFRCLDTREFIGIESKESSNIEEYIIENDLIDDFTNFLKDVSGQTFDFEKPRKGDTVLWYKVNGTKVLFNLTVSTGTHSLELLYFWMKRMRTTSFVFIDEFDAFYHFKLAYNVCKKLFDLPGQIFLSSHNTYLMTNDLLRPDCYFILNNNKILPLSKCTDKELREAHNLEKIYKAGAFYVE